MSCARVSLLSGVFVSPLRRRRGQRRASGGVDSDREHKVGDIDGHKVGEAAQCGSEPRRESHIDRGVIDARADV